MVPLAYGIPDPVVAVAVRDRRPCCGPGGRRVLALTCTRSSYRFGTCSTASEASGCAGQIRWRLTLEIGDHISQGKDQRPVIHRTTLEPKVQIELRCFARNGACNQTANLYCFGGRDEAQHRVADQSTC